MSSRFHDGEENYNGYGILTAKKIEEQKLDPKKFNAGQIVAVNDAGEVNAAVTVYDLSLTRNVVQMLIALTLLVVFLIKVARRYGSGQGITTSPKGMQNAMETIVNFINDEVARHQRSCRIPGRS